MLQCLYVGRSKLIKTKVGQQPIYLNCVYASDSHIKLYNNQKLPNIQRKSTNTALRYILYINTIFFIKFY